MDALPPLAAFQALCITTAAAVAIDARKEANLLRFTLFAVAAALALLGVFAAPIGEAWPASLALMQELGSSLIPWFALAVGFYVVLRNRTKIPAPEKVDLSSKTTSYDDTSLKAQISALETTTDRRFAKIETALDSLKQPPTPNRDDADSLQKLRDEFRRLNGRVTAALCRLNADAYEAAIWKTKGFIREALSAVNTRTATPAGLQEQIGAPLPNVEEACRHLERFLQNHNSEALGKLREEIAKAEAEIRADAMYRVIDNPDKEPWPSGVEKQNWYLRRAKLLALSSFLDRMHNGYVVLSRDHAGRVENQ